MLHPPLPRRGAGGEVKPGSKKVKDNILKAC